MGAGRGAGGESRQRAGVVAAAFFSEPPGFEPDEPAKPDAEDPDELVPDELEPESDELDDFSDEPADFSEVPDVDFSLTVGPAGTCDFDPSAPRGARESVR